jgi:hypothetical protein
MPEIDPNPRTPDDDSLFQGGNWFSRKMVHLIDQLTPKCTEMTHLISEEMDHPLPFFTRLKMRVHYLMCCYCERYKNNLHYMRSAFRSLHEHVDELSTAALSAETKERLKQTLRNAP